MNCFIYFKLSKTKANNTDFRTGKPVNTAPDWTGHVTSSANHCIVCKQGNDCSYSHLGPDGPYEVRYTLGLQRIMVKTTLKSDRFWSTIFCVIVYRVLFNEVRLQLHGTIYRPNSFVLIPCYCANLKAIGYQSTNLNRIVANKSHRVIVT